MLHCRKSLFQILNEYVARDGRKVFEVLSKAMVWCKVCKDNVEVSSTMEELSVHIQTDKHKLGLAQTLTLDQTENMERGSPQQNSREKSTSPILIKIQHAKEDFNLLFKRWMEENPNEPLQIKLKYYIFCKLCNVPVAVDCMHKLYGHLLTIKHSSNVGKFYHTGNFSNSSSSAFVGLKTIQPSGSIQIFNPRSLKYWVEKIDKERCFELDKTKKHFSCKVCGTPVKLSSRKNILEHKATNKHQRNVAKFLRNQNLFQSPEIDLGSSTIGEESMEVDVGEQSRITSLTSSVGLEMPREIVTPQEILRTGQNELTGEEMTWIKFHNLLRFPMLNRSVALQQWPKFVIEYFEGRPACWEDIFKKVPQGFFKGDGTLVPAKIICEAELNGIVYFLMTWKDSDNYDLIEFYEVYVRFFDLLEKFRRKVNYQPNTRSKSMVGILGDGKTGFEGLEAEQVLGATNLTGELMFLIKWKNSMGKDLVLGSEAKLRFPHVVASFYLSYLN